MSTEKGGPRVVELEEQVAVLQKELKRYQEREEKAAIRRRWTLGFTGRLLIGRDLRKSFRAWLEAKSLRDPFPADETAGALAAIVRRVIRVGVFGVVLGAIPTLMTAGFLVYQSLLMREQNVSIRDQIVQQTADTLVVRRAQLLATIYEEDCDAVVSEDAIESKADSSDRSEEVKNGSVSTEKVCRPRAHLRARQEAVLALSEIERSHDSQLDLSAANLTRLDLSNANLRGANLRGVNLSGANLNMADLCGSYLHEVNLHMTTLIKADLRGAFLYKANLRGANLSGANVVGANLRTADLREATLGKADLRDADLENADLRGSDLGSMKIGSVTRTPADADLRGADLRRAILTGADFREADLYGVNLIGADLYSAKLSSAYNLTQSQIEVTEGDPYTEIPKELRRPNHWQTEPGVLKRPVPSYVFYDGLQGFMPDGGDRYKCKSE